MNLPEIIHAETIRDVNSLPNAFQISNRKKFWLKYLILVSQNHFSNGYDADQFARTDYGTQGSYGGRQDDNDKVCFCYYLFFFCFDTVFFRQ